MALANINSYTIDDIYALPEGQRAELIDGQLYNIAPPSTSHQRIVFRLSSVIDKYIQKKAGTCEVFISPFAVFLNEDDRNYVEPDISIICDKNKLDDYGCHGAPDWIIEIVSPGNPSHDFIYKLNLYAKYGVREYWIVDPRSQTVLVYYLEQKDFYVKTYTFQDKIKVNIYEEFWIDFQELDL